MSESKQIKIYLAGPMSGIPDFNYPLFNSSAVTLRRMGFHVENPAENPEQLNWQSYMRQAIRQMLTCDVVVLLDGWSESKGAKIEQGLAIQVGMGVITYSHVITYPGCIQARIDSCIYPLSNKST